MGMSLKIDPYHTTFIIFINKILFINTLNPNKSPLENLTNVMFL